MNSGKINCRHEDCPCLYDPLTNEWYVRVQTTEWDEYNDDFVYERFYISYCPYCGRFLEGKYKDELS